MEVAKRAKAGLDLKIVAVRRRPELTTPEGLALVD